MDGLPTELQFKIGSYLTEWEDHACASEAIPTMNDECNAAPDINVASIVLKIASDCDYLLSLVKARPAETLTKRKIRQKLASDTPGMVETRTVRINPDRTLCPHPDQFGYKSVKFGIRDDKGARHLIDDVAIIVKLHLPGALSNIYADNGGPAIMSGSHLKSGRDYKYYTDYARVVGFQIYSNSPSAIRAALLAFQLRRAECYSRHDPDFTYALGETKVEANAGERDVDSGSCNGAGIYFFMDSHSSRLYSSIHGGDNVAPLLTHALKSRRGLIFDADSPHTRRQMERRSIRLNKWLRGVGLSPAIQSGPLPCDRPRRPVDDELDAQFASFVNLFITTQHQ
jgi:hypothetical protein